MPLVTAVDAAVSNASHKKNKTTCFGKNGRVSVFVTISALPLSSSSFLFLFHFSYYFLFSFSPSASRDTAMTTEKEINYPRQVCVPGMPKGWEAVERIYGHHAITFGRVYLRFAKKKNPGAYFDKTRHQNICSLKRVIQIDCEDKGIVPKAFLTDSPKKRGKRRGAKKQTCRVLDGASSTSLDKHPLQIPDSVQQDFQEFRRFLDSVDRRKL